MTYQGSYLRGEKWYLGNRDENGNITKTLSEDKDKMIDVNIYLEAVKKKEEEVKKKPTKSKGEK